jgi:hypothetical protein
MGNQKTCFPLVLHGSYCDCTGCEVQITVIGREHYPRRARKTHISGAIVLRTSVFAVAAGYLDMLGAASKEEGEGSETTSAIAMKARRLHPYT